MNWNTAKASAIPPAIRHPHPSPGPQHPVPYMIIEILPVQMVSLALAAQVGREPGRLELAAKVTTKE
jgi:hypothetical protein